MALEPFSDRHPDRFLNMGVAEQNMVGVATGLAEAGFTPYVYSIVTFATLRPFEFVRNGPVLHQLPVRIVGIGGGFEYGTAGPTHHGLEDVGVMRLLSGMTVVAPADHVQARSVMRVIQDLPGPVYIRLGKDDRSLVPGLDGRFDLGRAQTVLEGQDIAIIALGAAAIDAVAAAEILARHGIMARVIVVSSVAPAPLTDIAQAVFDVPLVVTVEAHNETGGLGSIVAEVIAEQGIQVKLHRCAVRSLGTPVTGSQAFLHDLHGLSAERIALVAERQLAVAGS